MVAQAVAAAPAIRVVTEIRGAPTRLWDGVTGEVIIAGSAGTGKTRAILEWLHHRCQQERVRFLLLRKTLESLKTSALVTYTEQVLYGFDGTRAAADGVTYFGGNRIKPAQFTYAATGSAIVLGGMDAAPKVLSTEYDAIYVNEVTELTLAEWETLVARTNRPRVGRLTPAVIIGDCNPDAPTHWIKTREQEGKVQLWTSYHEDNPAMWDRTRGEWTAAGRSYLATLDSLTGVRYQRLRLGKWVSAEGQVYDAWRDEVHLVNREDVTPLLASAWYFGTADWGWTNPGVLQVWAVDGDGRMILVAEHYHTRRPVEGWWVPRARELTAQYVVRMWVCDPAEPQNIAAFQQAGLPAQGAVNDILPGISAVEDRLPVQADGRPRLLMVRDALLERDEALREAKLPWATYQEIPLYVWPKSVGGAPVKDRPVDAYNHGLDCVRYAAMYLARPRPAVYVL